jgi:hypothetical protein
MGVDGLEGNGWLALMGFEVVAEGVAAVFPFITPRICKQYCFT